MSCALIYILFISLFPRYSDPNYVNGPYPCSPDTGTWLAVAASALFLISGCLGCCIPKPLPIIVRVKNSIQEDETDGCCAVFATNPKGESTDKEHDEEVGAVVAAGGVPGKTDNDEVGAIACRLFLTTNT